MATEVVQIYISCIIYVYDEKVLIKIGLLSERQELFVVCDSQVS